MSKKSHRKKRIVIYEDEFRYPLTVEMIPHLTERAMQHRTIFFSEMSAALGRPLSNGMYLGQHCGDLAEVCEKQGLEWLNLLVVSVDSKGIGSPWIMGVAGLSMKEWQRRVRQVYREASIWQRHVRIVKRPIGIEAPESSSAEPSSEAV
jgi:hypothetical protein